MNCPMCEYETKVINSRPDAESVHRRRQCINCGYRFNTIELDEDLLKKGPQKSEATPKPLRFSVEYDPATEKISIIKEAGR